MGRVLTKPVVYVLLFFVVMNGAALPCLSAVTAADLENRIKEAKILKPGDAVAAAINGDEAIIRKYGGGSEKDCKIEAVLISRAVIQADPEIKKVKVMFCDPADRARYSEVAVRAGFIKAFASGALSQADLLNSLDLVRKGEAVGPPLSSAALGAPRASDGAAAPSTVAGGDGSRSGGDRTAQESAAVPTAGIGGGAESLAAPTVSSGQFAGDLKGYLERINKLEKVTNTAAYMKQYKVVEDSIKTGNISQTRNEMDRLEQALRSQERALGQRRLAAQPPEAAGTAAQTADTSGSEHAHSVDDFKDLIGETFGSGSTEQNAEAYMRSFMSRKFVALTGPYYMERNYIGSTLMEKKRAGVDVSRYEPMFTELNACAKTGNKTLVYYKVMNAFKILGLDASGMASWRNQLHSHEWGR
jgi:hypothetical protein